jgi:hypothetical protein
LFIGVVVKVFNLYYNQEGNEETLNMALFVPSCILTVFSIYRNSFFSRTQAWPMVPLYHFFFRSRVQPAWCKDD